MWGASNNDPPIMRSLLESHYERFDESLGGEVENHKSGDHFIMSAILTKNDIFNPFTTGNTHYCVFDN